MTRYWFGYTIPFPSKTGIPSPIKWMTDNGSVIGPEFDYDKNNCWEITKLQFEGALLEVLMLKYPYKDQTDLTQQPSGAILVGKLENGGSDGKSATAESGASEQAASNAKAGKADPGSDQ